MSSSDGGDVRAEILDLGDQRLLAAEIIIDAPANVIFDILVQPQRHIDVDGQRSVQSVISGPERLTLGSKFTMGMRLGVRYRITSTVLEFVPNKRITWAHLLGNRWSYDLTALSPTQTLVRETNDLKAAGWRGRLSPVARNPEGMRKAIAKSLVRLKAMAEAST
jgi:hypothetical protein